MTDFHFASPEFLFALPALAVLWFVFRQLDRRVRDRLSKFLHEANLQQLLQGGATVRDRGRKVAFWLGLTLLTLALARPQANPTVEEMQSSGLDIYVLLDVSRSMDCEDVAPSRLKKAKRTIEHLTERLAGDRVGVIAFANSAVLVSPLTNDYSIIDSYLKNIDTGIVPSQGTNFAVALETARDAMERGAKNAKPGATHTNIFLILSDGEDHADSDLSIVDTIRKEGGLVFTIAFGTEKGAPIPMRDEKGELKGYKKDAAGNVVVTKVEPKTLEEIAKRGGGQFYHSTLDEGEVEDVLARVNDSQRGSFTTIKTTVWEEYFWVFLAPGLFLLLISFVPLSALRQGRGWLARLRPGLPKAGAAAVLLALLPVPAHAGLLSFFWDKNRKASEQSAALAKEQKFSDAADALKSLQAENPDSPEVNYDIGTYLLADKKGRLGREQLGHLRGSDGFVGDLALFNTAGSWALEGKKEEARAAYAELLQNLQNKQEKSKLTNAESALLAEAKRNVARLADPAQQPPPQQDQSDKQQQNQQDQKDQKQSGQDQQKQQSQGGGGQDQKDKKDENKGNDGKGQGDQKEDKQKGQGDDKDKKDQKDQKDQGDQKKEQQDKGQDQKDQEKKDQQGQSQAGNQQQNPQGQQNQNQLPPRRGGQPFKERDDMGENEARRILGALKERESDLQKKLLKNQVKGGRVNVDDAGKDW